MFDEKESKSALAKIITDNTANNDSIFYWVFLNLLLSIVRAAVLILPKSREVSFT